MLRPVSNTKQSLAERYMSMDEKDIGVYASGGYGIDKRKQFVSDIRELARLAQKSEISGGAAP